MDDHLSATRSPGKRISRKKCSGGRFRKKKIRIACFSALFLLATGRIGLSAARPQAHGMPVILDTDIGDDIDDTWALIILLKSPDFDLKLVTTTHGKAVYRAKLVARILEAAGRGGATRC